MAEAEDIVIAWIAGDAPVQGEGTVGGEPFYFRARGNQWRLEIGGGYPPKWEYGEPYGDAPFDASYMDVEVARGFILREARRYLAGEPSQPPPPPPARA